MLYLLTYNSLHELFSYLLIILEFSYILFGLYVIRSKNPILSVLYLIGLFLLVSIYLILLGIYFIGISYLLVYIGAVSILFLFILMLIDIRVSELQTQTMNTIILGSLLAAGFYIPVKNLEIFYLRASEYYSLFITHNNWESFLVENEDIVTIGNIIYTNLCLWLLISLLILLLSMVGAIVINLDNKSN